MPSHPESNLEGPYLTHDFNDPLSFSAQSNTTLKDNWITKQTYTIMETYSVEVDRPNWWGKPLLSSSYAPRVPSPAILESLTSFDGMEKEIEDVIESIEDSLET